MLRLRDGPKPPKATPGFTLTIQDYALGSSKLRFGTSNAGLTATQLRQIQFADFDNAPGVIDSNGFVTPYELKITAITLSGGPVQLDWPAIDGRTYRVWSKDTITAPGWDYQAEVTASGDAASWTDPSPSSTGRFYRLELL